LHLIYREEKVHRPDNPGHIIIKANSLTDIELVDALYHVARAGVKVDLLIRGNCCLRAGVPGLSENIRVTSVVGRFLEHSRIFYFHNEGQSEIFLASADCMRRNLDRRVETMFPVEDPQLERRIYDEILQIYLRDNTRARMLLPDGSYVRMRPREGETPFDSQAYLLAQAIQQGRDEEE
jgi:polyphosphate kinase